MTRTHKYLLAFFIVLLVLGGVFRLYHAGVIGSPDRKKDIEFTTLPEKTVRVHVKGAVRKPGVYALKRGDRCIDAVEAAGGFTEDADVEDGNLARFLNDGQEVNIPRLGYGRSSAKGQGGAGEPAVSKVKPGEVVNINTAGEAELMRLPGVGPVLASRIVQTRGRRGTFKDKQEIMLVPGIGRHKYIQLEKHIIVKKP